MRNSEITRKTGETDITLKLELDGSGTGDIGTGVGFLDHMLMLFARHGGFDLAVKCSGDTQVDNHHTVEDIGICLGRAFAETLKDGRGITRYADVTLPMDEALVLCAIDISGRGYLGFDVPFPAHAVGSFETELLEEFMTAFTRTSGVTVHMRLICGKNTHHIVEACFKALARALRAAVRFDGGNEIPSTKGMLL